LKTCGATPGGPSLDGIDVTTQTIIQGVVLRDGDDGVPNGTPVGNAHVRLLDCDGEFTAELPTNLQGQFRFFAAPGVWTLIVQAPGVRVEQQVTAAQGVPADVLISL
jgi:Protein of unknown function (DUF1416)